MVLVGGRGSLCIAADMITRSSIIAHISVPIFAPEGCSYPISSNFLVLYRIAFVYHSCCVNRNLCKQDDQTSLNG